MTTRRNALVMGLTAVGMSGLLLFPTSRGTGLSGAATKPAPVGVVAAPSSSASPTAVPSLVVNGSSVDTQFGPVQVRITIRAGKILSAEALNYPQGSGRDREINSFAIPALGREVLTAQSAQIDTISGATYTSQGYVESLQAALDAAHL